MVLKLNGKPLELWPEAPIVKAIKKFLDSAPADELFFKEELAKKVGFSVNHVKDTGGDSALAAYTLKVSSKRYFGHPKAIVELRKQVAK